MTKTPSKDTQKGLETLFSKYQLLPVLREQFSEIVDPEKLTAVGVEPEMVTEALVQIYLHRQADISTMVGILSPKFGTAQQVADKLLTICELDFMDVEEREIRDVTTGLSEFVHVVIVKFEVSADIEQMLALYQYPLPMVIKPVAVKDNFDTGYLQGGGSVILNGSDYFDDTDQCLDHLNRANSVALAMNFAVVKSQEGKFIKPVRNIGEDFDEFQKRVKQANTFYETSVQAMETLDSLSDQIYFTHKYDRRGRVYCSGYHLSYQGDDYRKSCLVLANKEVLNTGDE